MTAASGEMFSIRAATRSSNEAISVENKSKTTTENAFAARIKRQQSIRGGKRLTTTR